MQDIDERIVILLYKHIAGEEPEEEEQAELDAWLAESPHHRALLAELQDEPRLEKELKALMAIDDDAALKKLQDRITREKAAGRRPLVNGMRYAAAAIMLLLLAAGVYSWWQYRQRIKLPVAALQKNNVAPGRSKALLYLADGSAIVLDDAANGILKQEAGVVVRKKDSLLAYEAMPGTAVPETVSYNTISTPEKGQYQVLLPDGSRVWLNGGSSLRFPTVFAGPERRLTLKGEAFFDIASVYAGPGKKIPLLVAVTNDAGEQGDVEVLGTRFNINAYPDEATINTMLVEGVVRLRSANKAQPLTVLRPGQEAQLAKNGTVKLANADMALVTAWKEGNFVFRDAKIETIMRMISRWYGVKVVYAGVITQTFTGRFPRNLPLPKLLGFLSMTGDVQFSVDGGTVTVGRR